MPGWLIALVVVAVLAAAGGKAWWYIEREHKEARSLPLDAVDFSKLNDGTYTGEYEGGMYKWRTNSVRVTVSGGKATQIEPLSGVEDQGSGKTQMLYDGSSRRNRCRWTPSAARPSPRTPISRQSKMPCCRRSKANSCFALRRETR